MARILLEQVTMLRRIWTTRFVAVTASLAVLAALPATASAAPCTDLPNVVIGVGGSASKPLLAKVAPALLDGDDPITLVYQSPGACFGITTYVDATPITGTASFWNADGTEGTCELPLTGLTPDFGMLGVQATLCQGVTEIPDGIGEFFGPITSWSLIVPVDSSQQNISAEAVYFIYGFGAALGEVAPWIVDAQLYSRNATSAALIAIAIAANIPVTKFKGVDVGTNQAMVTSVANSTDPEAAIGFVSTEVADLNRDKVRSLAFQAYDQDCAFWPDSTATAFDKRNVRDGHYYLWSPYRFYVPVDANGDITDPDVARLIGYFDGSVELPPTLPLLDITIENGNIPDCAMTVTRTDEIGPLSSFAPAEPCGCYYEFKATGETSCEVCDAQADCDAGSGGTCRRGFCEPA